MIFLQNYIDIVDGWSMEQETTKPLLNEQTIAEMKEGYEALADEHKKFAAMVLKVAIEVVPEWK